MIDRDYFEGKLLRILESISSYTGEEMARELLRLALVANEKAVIEEIDWRNKQNEVVQQRK